MKGKLKDGFEVFINEKIIDDWNYLTLLREIDKGNAALIVDAADLLLGGKEEADKLAKHLEVGGKTTVTAMVEALQEIMESINETKNS